MLRVSPLRDPCRDLTSLSQVSAGVLDPRIATSNFRRLERCFLLQSSRVGSPDSNRSAPVPESARRLTMACSAVAGRQHHSLSLTPRFPPAAGTARSDCAETKRTLQSKRSLATQANQDNANLPWLALPRRPRAGPVSAPFLSCWMAAGIAARLPQRG